MWIHENLNPFLDNVGDCVIRAIAIATDNDWDSVYIDLALVGFRIKDMPSANRTWMEHLKELGFRRYIIPDTCPDCYTVKAFCIDHPKGTYILATGTHVVCVIDGNYHDSWDSGNEVPIYYFER